MDQYEAPKLGDAVDQSKAAIAYPCVMASTKKAKTKPKKHAGPSIGVGHEDWPSENPGMKPLPKKKAPKKG